VAINTPLVEMKLKKNIGLKLVEVEGLGEIMGQRVVRVHRLWKRSY
jgi:hypothetical protein